MNPLVPRIAVNIEVRIPMERVIEKPLIGPDPRKNKIIAEIKVVMLASRTAVLAFV